MQMAKYTSIGGQALIEGILMKSPEKTAMAVRLPDKTIDISYMDGGNIRQKYKILSIPVIRGVAAFIESLTQGYKALMLSAEKSGFADLEEENGEKSEEENAAQEKKNGAFMNIIMVKYKIEIYE